MYGDAKEDSQVLLDSNHSYFIIFDTENSNQQEREDIFRTRLEAELKKKPMSRFQKRFDFSSLNTTEDLIKSIQPETTNQESKKNQIPSVKICIRGGHKMLVLCSKYLKQKIPILLLKVAFTSFFIFYF